MDYAEKLLTWYDSSKREMPWRKTNDAYAIWVSEIMLQQTQVETVIPYYEKFMTRFPDIHSLAAAPLEEIFHYWQGLGYYRRAENLHKGAQMIDREYGGIFPAEPELIKKIPGIGPYTAGAILSIAYGKPYPAVDGNVMRILSRQFLMSEDIRLAKSRVAFENKVMSLMSDDPNRFNQALMELGALVCTPKTPKCNGCPISSLCRAFENNSVLDYPIKSPKAKSITEKYKIVIIKKEEAYWMEKRKEEGLLAHLWGFPMIQSDGFKRDFKVPQTVLFLKTVTHVFTHRKWLMEPVVIDFLNQDILNQSLLNTVMLKNQDGKFVTFKEMDGLPIATAFKKVIDELKKYEKQP